MPYLPIGFESKGNFNKDEHDPGEYPDAAQLVPRAEPLDDTTTRSWRSQLDVSMEALQVALRNGKLSKDERLARNFSLRLLALARGDTESAMQRLPGVSEDEQEFLQNVLFGLQVFIDKRAEAEDDERLAEAREFIKKALHDLRNQSALRLRNAAFCSAVEGFGNYTEFSKATFTPGQELGLYVEVVNFLSQPVDTEFETELRGSYELRRGNESGTRVADERLPRDKQRCRNCRTDYYLAYSIRLPDDVEPGEYTLKLSIRDVKGKKSQQVNLPLRIKEK